MKKSCFRCGGDGFLPQFSHIRGGVCFTCGGDGEVNTFSVIKLNKMEKKEDIRSYVEHSSNRDIATLVKSGEYGKLKDAQRTRVTDELWYRSERYGLNPTDYYSMEKLAEDVLTKLDALEKNMPKPYEKDPYFKAGKVSLVPVHWLKKFQGNSLRRDSKAMQEFAEELKRDGLTDPVMMIIGQEDRNVSVGEGNHRMNAFELAGLDYVPVRVARSMTNLRGTYYDKMSRVPEDEYFPADASPENVFDTFYDHDELPEKPEPEPEVDLDDDDFADLILDDDDDY